MTPSQILRKPTLHDMGGGLLYDEVLDLTWLQDASYSKTSGYKANGKMTWKEANRWAQNLVYRDTVRGRDITGWRMPRVRPADGIRFNGRFCFDGSSDEGYGMVNPCSELGYMFYVNLGLKGYYSPSGEVQSGVCGIAGNGQRGYLVDAGPVKNLLSYIYWTETPVPPYEHRNAWMFDAQFGFQNFYNQNDMLCAWAVHDGNVAGDIPACERDAEGRAVITIVAEPESREELDTYTEMLGERRCEFAFNNSIPAEPYHIMWSGMETVVTTPDLVAFWTFGEKPGQARTSILGGAPYRLEEVGGPVERVDGGPYSGFSARFDGAHYLRIPRERIGELDIHGPDAQVSMFAAVYLEEMSQWGGTIAGIWSEGKGAHDDTGTRQYAMLFNMPTYGGARQLTPHISAEGGVSRRADGSGLPWCADYAASRSEIPLGKWVTLGFTYDGQRIRAYFNGVLEQRAMDPVADKRDDPYFIQEGPRRGYRGMNPYYHGRGIFSYDPEKHAVSKPGGPADFTVGARFAGGSMLGEALKGRIGGLAVFKRALSEREMKALHDSTNFQALKLI